MATSVVTAADTTTNPTGAPPDHHSIRRSSGGRRKSKGSESSSTATSAAAAQKKKQRQRGMGVEKLERIIHQDTWKNLTEINPHAHLMNINAFISPPLQMNHNAFHGGESFSALNCFSQHCDACHKKKKVDCEGLGSSQTHCRFLGLNQKKQGFGKGVEVVAVHRRGSEGGGVVMEYEFFPSSSSKACDDLSAESNEDLMMMMMKKQRGSSSSSMGGFDASNCIDLSLKLSY